MISQTKTAAQLAMSTDTNRQTLTLLSRTKRPIGVASTTISGFNAEAGTAITERGPLTTLNNNILPTSTAQAQQTSVIPTRTN